MATALAAAGDVAYEWDVATGAIEWLGDAVAFMGEAFAGIATADALAERIFADDVTARAKALARHLGGEGLYDSEYRIRDDHDDPIWVHDRGRATLDAGGQPVRIVGVLRAIGARKSREAQLEFLASHDELTGHFNRARLKDSLEHALNFATRYEVPGAYMVLGIDKLGPINDAFGHEAADAVIVAIGRLLDRSLRNTDVIGRIGGDRFGVVLSHCPLDDVALTAEKLLTAVRQAKIETPAGEIHVTVSIGAVSFREHAPTVSEVMSRGDSALQSAKHQGRNCFSIYEDSPAHREQRRYAVAIVEEVQTGLKDGRIMLAYQPIVDALTHAVDHYECLMRLRRRDGQIVTAGAFVPLVEQSGLMRQVDRRALELAIEEMCAHPRVKLAVNISGHTAADRAWLRMLSALVRGMPEVAERLTVEITETVALQDIDDTARFVSKLRDLGCRVALDDFGAGYTSFRNLKALDVDCVKIDGSFVKGLSENVDNQLFVRTLLGLAEGLGLKTVAECVETAADAALLARRGVRYLQGWYFGKPVLERPWLADEAFNPPRAAAASGPPKLTVVSSTS
ncbi:MAG: EAL domain-containing protein [Alphaproteobacteria bacterium]|nr:EAL domain-containing protein [Alphaproteobacteria bacterium]